MASAATLHAAVGAVLEADRARQSAGELAVALAFGGARANHAQLWVADELRLTNQIGAHRHAERQHVEQQLARHFHPR
jgi:hypothetical protein